MKLADLPVFVRSKNAGPFMLTIDLMFETEKDYELAVRSNAFTSASVSALYGLRPEHVDVYNIYFARSIKISFPRRVQAGHPSDSDIAGGQQFVPLMGIEFGDD